MATGSGKVWKLILQCPGFQANSEHPVLSRRRGPFQQVFNCLSTYMCKSMLKPSSVKHDTCTYLRYSTTSVNKKSGSANGRNVSQSSIQNSESTLKQGLVVKSKIQPVDAKQKANTTSVNKKSKRSNGRKVSRPLIQILWSTLGQGVVAKSKIQSVDANLKANTNNGNKKSKRSNGTLKQGLVVKSKIQPVDAKQKASTTSVKKKSKRSNGKKENRSLIQILWSKLSQGVVAKSKIQSVDANLKANTTVGNKKSKRSNGRVSRSLIQNSGSTLRQGVSAKSKIQSVDVKQEAHTATATGEGIKANCEKVSQSSVQTSKSTVKEGLVAKSKIQTVDANQKTNTTNVKTKGKRADLRKVSQSSVQVSSSTVDQGLETEPTIRPVDAEQEAKMIFQFLEGHLTIREYIGKLQNKLKNAWANGEAISQILNQEASTLNTPGIRIFLGLLNTLERRPQLALEVFNWKRTRSDMTIDLNEYSKSIILAGRAKDVDLAVELFSEIESRGIKKETSVYNALMTAYVCNGLTTKTLALFDDLKRDPDCSPTIVTYNILLSTFGRSMLVEHMEMVNQAIKESNLPPDIYTYNTLIAGYLTAWMWDEMEKVFKKMERYSVEPNSSTYSLLVRGYAFSGQLRKMEEAFNYLKGKIYEKDVPIIRAMIHAYFKSTDAAKITKIDKLLKFIPENEYRPWLDVILIVLYAQADAVEKMETSIIGALSRRTMITTTSVTRSVTNTYFKHDAIDKLEAFVKQTKTAGWKLCHSVYHGKMVMYGFQNRLSDMENVMEEMKSSGFSPVKKTFLILYKVYMKFRKEDEVKWTLKRMKNAGFDLPEDSKILADECFAELLY